MEELKERIVDLAVVAIAEHTHLLYQAVTDAVAAFLFPCIPTGQIDETQYLGISSNRVLTHAKKPNTRARAALRTSRRVSIIVVN